MKDLVKEVRAQVIAKAKKENRNDFENLFKEVMNNRLSFYREFDKNFDINVTNIQHYLDNN